MRIGQRHAIRAGDGASICVESIGERQDPTILLIAANSWSMDWWEDELCERIVAQGRRVIRYDNRDTGRSTSYPPGAPGYGGAELLELEGVGHQLPPPHTWDALVEALIDRTRTHAAKG